MIFYKKTEREELLKSRGINTALIIIFIFIVVKIVQIMTNSMGSIGYSEAIGDMESVNYTLAIMSIVSCFLYYYTYKKGEFFIVTLIYTSFGIEYLLADSILKGKLYIDNEYINFLILAYIFRSVLITLIITKENKLTKFIEERKTFFVILTVAITITFIKFESILRSVSYYNFRENIVLDLNVILIIYHFFIIIMLAIRSVKEQEVIYIIIIASISLFTLKRLYTLVNLNKHNIMVEENCNLFTFIGFIILLIGILIEMFNRIRESDNLKEELRIFYNLTEYNKSNFTILYNKDRKAIYANELLRKKFSVKGISNNKQYEAIGNLISKQVNIEEMYYICKELAQKGCSNRIVKLKDECILKVDINRVWVKKDDYMFVSSFSDITSTYRNNEKLKINEERLRCITKNIKEIIVTTDINWNINYANDSIDAILGYSKDEILGKSLSILYNNNEIEVEHDESKFIKHKIKSKDNRDITMESVVSKIINDNGEKIGSVIVSRDISSRNEYEALKMKYDKMKEYEKIRSEFFANLSHEFKTPINIIYSCIQLFNKQNENGAENLSICYSKYETAIRQNCFRMLRLINNLIDITKFDSGFMKMNFINIDIVKLVEDITLSIAPYVEEKNINVIFDTDIEELDIKCDPDKIERVMLNLISNSVKFTEANGHIFVSINTDEKFVKISVKDDGIGIPSEFKDFVFERFVQGDKSLNRGTEGSGIGLALVKSIVDMHKGKVYLKDSSELGSEFIVEIPNIKCDECVLNSTYIIEDKKAIADRIKIEFSDIYDL
ncbi:hypothetical protein JCM1393_15080 [Clostridium carnis]